jgi:two-component system, cell cycle sensor histidine kinase and response regulator CckA
LLAVIRDISSRKLAEIALQEKEAMLRVLGDNLPNGFIYQVVRELDGSDRFYYISQGVERETGFKPEEILANTNLLHDLLIEEDRQRMNRIVEESMRNLSIFDIQVRERSPRGELRWLHLCSAPRRLEDGRIIWDGIRVDITELKQAEAALSEREERLRLALAAARMGTWDWNILENDVTYSDEMQLIFGMPPEVTHSTYQAFLDAVHPQDRAFVVNAIDSAIEGKTDYWIEYRVLGFDSNWRWVVSKGQVYRDRNGKPARMVGVAMDITEKKQLEAQLLRIQRLENLGTLASGISHDLNNILTPILVVAQLLQLKYPDSERREMLDMIVANAKRGADLVKQVVSFARGVEGNRQTIQMQSSLIEVVQIVKQTFPKSIAIDTDIPSDLWAVTADATQLHQVLMNLCLNARDAMPDGGTLKIAATNLYIDESYARMRLEAKVGSYVVITIADTGCGIPPEKLDRIFDPFFTTKATGKGTGLGLSTVLGIVKSHGGFIDVSSRVGRGTQLQVYLPSSEGDPFNAAEDLELLVGRGELILVVDDESAIDAAIESTLTNHNYRVITAKNGIEAIAFYAQYKHEINLVLIDIMMPEMDGTTAIQALQRINPQIQIVAMSGMKSASAIAQATNSSIQGFLPKPFTSQELLKTLQQVLRAA